jgi:hypothetical protein
MGMRRADPIIFRDQLVEWVRQVANASKNMAANCLVASPLLEGRQRGR